jgi:hypothetical protein
MQRPSFSAIVSFASQASEWLVLLLLLAAATPPILLRRASLTIVPSFNLLDGSWILDTSYKAAGGIWFGRDVAFTYGPLFQWLSSAPSRWVGISVGSILATWYTLPFCVIVIATFLTARLLLPAAPAWRRAILALLAVVFWSPSDVRVSFCLLAFAIFLRLGDAVMARKTSVLVGALTAAAICIIAFLLAADSGVFVSAAFVLCLVATAIARGRVLRAAQFLLETVIFVAALVVATDAAMGSWLNSQFWHSSLAIASGYRWFEPSAMSQADKHQLFLSLAVGGAIFLLAWFLREGRRSWTRRPAFLLAGIGLAFLMTQSGLVRSDRAHVLIGLYPLAFLCGAIALDEFESWPWLGLFLPLIVVVATAGLAHVPSIFLPASVAAQARQIRHPVLACPAGMQEFDRACFSAADAQLLGSISSFVDSQTVPGRRIAVFPYQTALGLASRRQVAGGILQGYLVNGNYLTEVEVAGLQQADPPLALYFPDTPTSPSLDWVASFTRSPGVWFYYFRHYRLLGAPAPEAVGLVRDDSRDGRIRFSSQSISQSATVIAIKKRSTTIDLGQVRWPSDGADFLKLRLRIDYPVWWRMRKPSCLTLEMYFADGSRKPMQLAVPPNQATDIWVYPGDEKDMVSYFSSDQTQWRPNRPALTGLRLLVTPYDWISVVPNSVSVESIEAIQVGLE